MRHSAASSLLLAAASLLLSLALVSACGRGKSSSSETAPELPTRPFPHASTPQLMGDPMDQARFYVQHFWDNYLSGADRYRTDSLYFGGVEVNELEEAYGLYTARLWAVPLDEAQKSMENLFGLMSKPGVPDGVKQRMIEMTRRYLYDPNSPMRCEDFFRPFAERLLHSDLISDDERMQYEYEVRMCGLNAMGTPAADFVFIDTKGRQRTLYSISSAYLLLIFGNPDCHACKELVEMMETDPAANDLIQSGRLTVLDVFIDQEIDLWKERMHDYPKEWINGYDPTFQIRNDHLYNVRAVPSMYLLDADKKVLLKDASEPILMRMLQLI